LDAMRRLRTRSQNSPPRRVPLSGSGGATVRLRGPGRRMSQALDQLRAGVPLNWGQVEDDPELATLARLQEAGAECRAMTVPEPSADFRAHLFDTLSARLPREKALPQAPTAPRTLAGFSERVQVLTQADDNVQLGANVPVLIARGALIILVLVGVFWGLNVVLSAATTPTFSWIELKRGDDTLNRINRPADWSDLPCRVARRDNPNRPGSFVPIRSMIDAQDKAGFHIPVLSSHVTVPTTSSVRLDYISIDPCEGDVPAASDEGAMFKQQYTLERRTGGRNATSTVVGTPRGVRVQTIPIIGYVAYKQPSPLNISSGDWREVRVGDLHGVYWRGGPYRDRAGAQWEGDISVLIIERDDTVMTLIGDNADGVTGDLLIDAAAKAFWRGDEPTEVIPVEPTSTTSSKVLPAGTPGIRPGGAPGQVSNQVSR
jgi:hypothetical protein